MRKIDIEATKSKTSFHMQDRGSFEAILHGNHPDLRNQTKGNERVNRT